MNALLWLAFQFFAYYKCIFRWLRGDSYDVEAEFDKYTRMQNEHNDCTTYYEQKYY